MTRGKQKIFHALAKPDRWRFALGLALLGSITQFSGAASSAHADGFGAAQRIRRALAKAAVQWKDDAEMTAAAA